MAERPKVGVGIYIFNDQGQLLLGKRISDSHGDGTWSPPGGHLEFGETPEKCAIREALEEVNLTVDGELETLGFTNDVFEKEQKHYVTIHLRSNSFSGELINNEPHKCEKWEWFDLGNLPSPLALYTENFIKKNKL